MRILLLLALGLLLYLVFVNLFRRKPSTDLPAKAEIMVRCEHCGLHLPEHEAISQDKHYFCSTEHLELTRKSK